MRGRRRLRAAPLAAALALLVLAGSYTPARGANGQDWLGEINEYRLASGLNPVTDDPSLDAALRQHLLYLAKTPASYRTGAYRSVHTENPQSPYYTAEGAREAAASELSGGPDSPVSTIDGLLASPFHAVGILAPGLERVAFVSDDGEAGLDVSTDLGPDAGAARSAPILFPGDGMTTNLETFSGDENPNPLETCGWSGATGLPLVALLPGAPAAGLTAQLSGPASTGNGEAGTLCIVDGRTYRSSDPVYGATGEQILHGDDAVFLIPRTPLRPGAYQATIHQPGEPDIAWSFTVSGPTASACGAVVRPALLHRATNRPDIAREIFAALNRARASAGLPPLQVSAGLARAASLTAIESAAARRELRPDSVRFADCDPSWLHAWYVGEAERGLDGADLIDNLAGSPSRPPVLTPSARAVGIGAAVGDDGSTYWTVASSAAANAPSSPPPALAPTEVTAAPGRRLRLSVLRGEAVDSFPLSLVRASAAHGTVGVTGKTLVYSPPHGFRGLDRIRYSAIDVYGRIVGGVVRVRIGE